MRLRRFKPDNTTQLQRLSAGLFAFSLRSPSVDLTARKLIVCKLRAREVPDDTILGLDYKSTRGICRESEAPNEGRFLKE